MAQRLDDMQAAGTLDEESARALAESRDEAARAEHYDELGQSIIECIWNAGGVKRAAPKDGPVVVRGMQWPISQR